MYRELAVRFPTRIRTVDAAGSPFEVQKLLEKELSTFWNEKIAV
jgi:thymidylate kinase